MGSIVLALKVVGSNISRFFWWLVNHPNTIVVIVSSTISGLAVAHWMRNRYEDRLAVLQADVARFQQADEIRVKRIQELEQSSAKAGDVLDKQREDTARQLAGITEKYSQALTLDRGRQVSLTCQPPPPQAGAAVAATPAQPPGPVQVGWENGHVVCDHFPQAFESVVNESILLVQQKLAAP